ncbi:DNA-binding protein [Enterococcus florum]|uniref:DNA-binding protein n=1 Tax=Enterococcus florum TaxID=2480627 RepID=A0A4P5PFB8_9ENTE|nr:DNA-binding protein [Enterococcus florum]GCF92143.1 DNA-binding protein [Enterococcus florum]
MDNENKEVHLDEKTLTIIHYILEIASIKELPLVLTNSDLKKEFQISDSTLNRLINYTEFPPCWKGIRGHYLRDDIIAWYRDKDFEGFRKIMREINSL